MTEKTYKKLLEKNLNIQEFEKIKEIYEEYFHISQYDHTNKHDNFIIEVMEFYK